MAMMFLESQGLEGCCGWTCHTLARPTPRSLPPTPTPSHAALLRFLILLVTAHQGLPA